MSMSLLKKSMAIVEEDLPDTKETKGNSKKSKIRKQKDVHGELRVQKTTIEDVRREIESARTRSEENVQKLLLLTKHPVKIPNPGKIINRAHNGRYVVEETKPVEMESLYTEEDFAMFEKELAKMT